MPDVPHKHVCLLSLEQAADVTSSERASLPAALPEAAVSHAAF